MVFNDFGLTGPVGDIKTCMVDIYVCSRVLSYGFNDFLLPGPVCNFKTCMVDISACS